MKKQYEEITIKELIDIFLPKVWVIVLVAVIFAGVMGGYAQFIKDDTYTSTASFVMIKIPTQYGETVNNAAITTGLNAAEIEAMQSMIAMTEQVMETTDYLTTVKEQLVERNPSYESVSIAQLKNMLSIEVVGEATCFELSAVSTDPQLSYDVTDIVYHTFPQVIGDLFESISISIKVIDSPLKAKAPNGKGVLKNVVIGGFGGAILTMLVIFVITKLDVIIRSKEKIEAGFDIPVIGLIPKFDNEN